VAGIALNSERPWGERLRSAVRAAGFYAAWYPRQWLPLPATVPAGMHPRLAAHLRGVERQARRMARTLFHQMVKVGPQLEKRQVLLGRIADIGSDLFALAATCVYAQWRLQAGGEEARILAMTDDFARQARARIAVNFRGVSDNTDGAGYALAQDVVAGAHAWVEDGIV